MKRDRNTVIFGGVVIALVIASFFMIYTHVSNVEDEFITWNGPNGEYRLQLISKGNTTLYNIFVDAGEQSFSYPLRYLPSEVINIPLTGDLVEILLTKKGVYTTRDLDLGEETGQKSSIAALEFGKILGSADYGLYKVPVKAAFTELTEEDKMAGLPLVTCDNVTQSIGVIYMKLGDSNQVYTEGDCLIVQGVDAEGLVKSADRLAYALLGAI